MTRQKGEIGLTVAFFLIVASLVSTVAVNTIKNFDTRKRAATPTSTPIVNSISNGFSSKSCSDICKGISATCQSVGTNPEGTNGNFFSVMKRGEDIGTCVENQTSTYSVDKGCGTAMDYQPSNAGDTCSGYKVNWTRCNCLSNLPTKTPTPIPTSIPATTSVPKVVTSSCTDKLAEVKNLVLNTVNYCANDSDCTVQYAGCPVTCHYLLNKNEVVNAQTAIDNYFANCRSDCMYKCLSQPKATEIKCNSGKCVDTRFLPSLTPTLTPTRTPTVTITPTVGGPSITSTRTPTQMPTITPTPTRTLTPTRTPTVTPPAGGPSSTPTPVAGAISPRVYLLIYNPILKTKGNKRMNEYKGWRHPDAVTTEYRNDLYTSSGNTVNYTITVRNEVDGYVPWMNGQKWTDETAFINCLDNNVGCPPGDDPHAPNYVGIMNDANYGICDKLNNNQIDEFWVWYPNQMADRYSEAGYAGPHIYSIGYRIDGTSCQKLLPFMAFNSNNLWNDGNPLHNYSHRIEHLLSWDNVHGQYSTIPRTLWETFDGQQSRYGYSIGDPCDWMPPVETEDAHCGNSHFPPNGRCHYSYFATSPVVNSDCDDWLDYPHLDGTTTTINCTTWGCDQGPYLLWWFNHIPKSAGYTDGYLNNWWQYLANFNNAVKPICNYETKWGSSGSGNGYFNNPNGIAVDSSGNVYVADSGNNRVQKFDSSGVFITKWGSRGTGDNQFILPNSIAIDSSNNVYVADYENHRIQKFDSSGVFITKWGSGGTGNGQFTWPTGLSVDSSGNIYVADSGNNRIQKFTSAGTWLATWDSGGFNRPKAAITDLTGANIFVMDTLNNRVQKLNSSGVTTAVWGSGGNYRGQFIEPNGGAVDSSGNVYVVDNQNHRLQKFSPKVSGVCPTPGVEIDGSGYCFMAILGGSGTGNGNGEFIAPKSMAISAPNKIYVADSENNRIQKFSCTAGLGAMKTVMGAPASPTPTKKPIPTPTKKPSVWTNFWKKMILRRGL